MLLLSTPCIRSWLWQLLPKMIINIYLMSVIFSFVIFSDSSKWRDRISSTTTSPQSFSNHLTDLPSNKEIKLWLKFYRRIHTKLYSITSELKNIYNRVAIAQGLSIAGWDMKWNFLQKIIIEILLCISHYSQGN